MPDENIRSIPSLEAAERFLSEAASLNPGPWVPHSYYVAQGARLIAERHAGLDADLAYILGLLHDIGRRFGVTHMRHVLDGYRFMAGEGYESAGRVCLTHAYPIREDIIGATHWDGSADELLFVRQYLKSIAYDDYDRLIQLCDAISLPTGFCLMEKRLMEVAMRYGIQKRTLKRWQAYLALQRHFETAIGMSIYRILPGVVENTFDWLQ